MSQNTQKIETEPGGAGKRPFAQGGLEKSYKNALLILIILIVGGTLLSLA